MFPINVLSLCITIHFIKYRSACQNQYVCIIIRAICMKHCGGVTRDIFRKWPWGHVSKRKCRHRHNIRCTPHYCVQYDKEHEWDSESQSSAKTSVRRPLAPPLDHGERNLLSRERLIHFILYYTPHTSCRHLTW